MGRKRRRTNWNFRGVVLGLLGALFAYVLIGAAAQSATSPYRFADLLVPRMIDCLVAAWLFWVGSAIGSFLNVVAWRMPRGQSINGFSHCPRCNHRLRAQDNWPVFGWLALRGRCRTCRLPISPRYPIVELAVGLTILAVGYVELYLGQWNLPTPGQFHHEHGPMAMPYVTRQAMGICLYHTVAVACSWALGLVRFDQQKLPPALTRFVLAAIIAPMLFWPPVMQVPWQAARPEDWPAWSFLDAVMRVIAAIVAAALVARSMARYVCPGADLKLDPLGTDTKRLVDLVVMLTVPAVILGWQALLGVLLVASLLAALLRRKFPISDDGLAWFAVCLPIVLALHLVLWRPLESLGYWPSSQSSPWLIIVAACFSLIVPVGLRNKRVDKQSQPLAEQYEDDDSTDSEEVPPEERATEPPDTSPEENPRSAELG